MDLDYKKLGLKIGLEIHRQLDTYKLFCACPSLLREDKADVKIKRFLRPVAGELGEVDVAALHETMKKRCNVYEAYSDTTCLVELDEEPPNPINQEALRSSLEIALLLKARVVDEVQVMRKTVLDGSNTAGFQRTALIAQGGFVETPSGKINIQTICLEEDAARIIKQSKKFVVYRLDRLGIPLIEIATAPEIKSPKQAREVAEVVGNLLKATGKVKTGIGTIRQDLNMSIKNGARIEIKGVQNLNLIPVVIEKEVQRQLALIKAGKKVQEEVRKANANGSTTYMRPMPGEARMYPETDIMPITIEHTKLAKLKKILPELPEKKRQRFLKMGLGKELANQILNSEYLQLFERMLKLKIEPKELASVFANVLPNLKTREKVAIENISQEQIEDTLKLLKTGKIVREALPTIFKELALRPKKSAYAVVREKNLSKLSEKEAEKIIRAIIEKEKTDKLNVIVGIAMSKLRGRIEGEKIAGIVKKLIQ